MDGLVCIAILPFTLPTKAAATKSRCKDPVEVIDVALNIDNK